MDQRRPKRDTDGEDPSPRQTKRGRARGTGNRSPEPGGPSASNPAAAAQEIAPRRGRGSFRGWRRRRRAVKRPVEVRAEAAVQSHRFGVASGQIQHEPVMRGFGPDNSGFMDMTPSRFSELPGPLDAVAATLPRPPLKELSLELSLRTLQQPPPDPSLVAAAIQNAQELYRQNSPPPEDLAAGPSIVRGYINTQDSPPPEDFADQFFS